MAPQRMYFRGAHNRRLFGKACAWEKKRFAGGFCRFVCAFAKWAYTA